MLAFPFYAAGFLISTLALVGWFYFQRRTDISRLFRFLLFAGLGIYLISMLAAALPFEVKMSAMVRDLLLIGGTGLLFQVLVRKRPAFFFGLMALGIVLFWYYKNHLQPTMAYTTPAAVELDEHGELLVEILEGKDIASLDELMEQYDIRYAPAFTLSFPEATDLDDYYVLDIPEQQAERLQEIERALSQSPVVEWVEPNEVITVDPDIPAKLPDDIRDKFGIDDPGLEYLWGFKEMGIDQLYTYLDKHKVKPKRQALIAILDTGVDAEHEDLQDNYKSTQSKYDNDPRGHGTHCAGIAAAVSNNGVGVASFSRNNEFVQVTSIKVLSALGSGTQRSIINGMLEAADKNADVISMSLGGRSTQSRQRAYEKAVKYANKKGAIVVAAAGNSNRNAKEFAPVNAAGVIGVSAVDESVNRAVFSNYITDLEMGIAAPGVNIYSTIPGSKYASFSGTSMATPYVAGMLGLLKSLDPDLTTEEAYQILDKTGAKTRATRETGRLIQPQHAVQSLMEKR